MGLLFVDLKLWPRVTCNGSNLKKTAGSVKSFHDCVGLNHISSFSFVGDGNLS